MESNLEETRKRWREREPKKGVKGKRKGGRVQKEKKREKINTRPEREEER